MRLLSTDEIIQLKNQNCSSSDWSLIQVSENFSADCICQTKFSGNIELGVFEKKHLLSGNLSQKSGISGSTLHNCRVGDNILMDNAYVANFDIGSETIIRNVSELFVDTKSLFGNGIEVAVLNETGGREVSVYDGLSAQLAYIQTFYRHKPELISQIRKLISGYAHSISSDRGVIGVGCKISNCGTLKNIRVGDAANLRGVTLLDNGSINSTTKAPVSVGENVIAKNFIFSSGANIESGASITNGFVGQAVHLANYFSATNSLFFSYCQGEQGEACAIFAGPFTVSHHKSTLLIGGYYSFMNAGSGTNQSNHHYRLGASHQGILERGCKTASDSYVLWPFRVGAFSLISGRHKTNADTSGLPFSYLVENAGESFLIPAATLRNVGTFRDAQKWTKRDTLSVTNRLDRINLKSFTPYTVQKIGRAIEVLRDLQNKQGSTTGVYHFQGVKINRSSLQKGLSLYECAFVKYLGDCLLSKIAKSDTIEFAQLITKIKPSNNEGLGKWVDLSGLIAPQQKVESLVLAIESGLIPGLSQIEKHFDALQLQFETDEWCWIVDQLEIRIGQKIDRWTPQLLIGFIQKYMAEMSFYYQNLIGDAQKEFADSTAVGYGIDGDEKVKSADFEAVHGAVDQHPVVQDLHRQAFQNKEIAESVIAKILATKYSPSKNIEPQI